MSDVRLASLADPASLLEAIFFSAPMALQIYARDGSCVLVNPAHTELFGGVPPPGYNIFGDTILIERGLVALIRRAFEGERISLPALWYDIRDLRNLPPETDVSGGKRIAISAELVPLRDGTGEVAHVLVVFNDQTATHEAREQAESAAAAAERRAAQSAFLAEASRLLAESLDLETTLRQIAKLLTPALADFCMVDLVDEDGSLRRLATAHADPSQQPVLDELLARFPPKPDSPQPGPRAIRSGRIELWGDTDAAVLSTRTLNPEHYALMERLQVRSHAAVPLQVGTRTLGAMTVAYAGDRRYTEHDVPFLEALASRAAVAIENARLYRTADTANRAKDEFLAMLGHELRNPLAPIVTALELSKERSKERDIIVRQVGHLRRLVDDLLDVSRITRGTLDLELVAIDLADVVFDGIEAAKPLVDQRAQRLTVEVPRGLYVNGDRARLAQIITNLLTNAARYTPPGGQIEVEAETRGVQRVVLVRDTGVGIPDELQPHIFEIFTRGGRSIDRAAGGLGLGLAIAKSLTEKHGGRVSVRSEGDGRGSEFEVALPAIDAPAKPAASVSLAPGHVFAGRVLVVDDNVDAAFLLSEALHLHGLETTIANDGPSALELARTTPPQVAIVDIGLPGMNGYELGAALHALPGLEELPVIALTGFGQPSDRARSEQAGFVGHFVKPVQLDSILDALEPLLRHRART